MFQHRCVYMCTVGLAHSYFGAMARLATHSWETGSEHSWESDARVDESDGGSSSEDEPSTEAAATGEFLNALQALYLSSTISAMTFCIICYWAGLAGLAVGQYGMAPGRSSGNYKRHLDAILKVPDYKKQLYDLDIIGHRKHDLSRAQHSLKVVPPHEALQEEISGNQTLAEQLAEAVASGSLPRAYQEHPLVLQSDPGTQIWPIGLYMDAVPYSHTDSVIGVWFINMISNCRHLCLVIRKRVSCKCGCRGWCTWQPIFRFLAWSLRAGASGTYPSARHDSSPWAPSDENRADWSGQAMAKIALVQVKGDWSEYCERFGFPPWTSNLRPCFYCAAPPYRMYDVSQVSPLGMPWHVNTASDYHEACSRCEVPVVITSASHELLKNNMFYDRRQAGFRGRALAKSVP